MSDRVSLAEPECREPSWYAVLTGSRCERIASTRLEGQGIRVFYPFIRVKRRRKIPNRDNFRLEEIEIAYMPRYIFALAAQDQIGLINATTGVATIVSAPMSRKALPIPDWQITALMMWAEPDGFVSSEDRTLPSAYFEGRVGDCFEFTTESAFAGLLATIASLDGLDSKHEIITSLTMLGSERQISVPVSAVGKIVSRTADRVAVGLAKLDHGDT